MDSYKIITRTALSCGECEKKFQGGEDHYSALRENEEEKILARLPFCLECWDKQNLEDFICYWKTRRKMEQPGSGPSFDREMALSLFTSLEGTTEEDLQKLRYLLGLVLIRKKIFRLKDISFKQRKEYFVLSYMGKGKGKDILLLAPKLAEEEIEPLKKKLLQALTLEEEEETQESETAETSGSPNEMDLPKNHSPQEESELLETEPTENLKDNPLHEEEEEEEAEDDEEESKWDDEEENTKEEAEGDGEDEEESKWDDEEGESTLEVKVVPISEMDQDQELWQEEEEEGEEDWDDDWDDDDDGDSLELKVALPTPKEASELEEDNWQEEDEDEDDWDDDEDQEEDKSPPPPAKKSRGKGKK